MQGLRDAGLDLDDRLVVSTLDSGVAKAGCRAQRDPGISGNDACAIRPRTAPPDGWTGAAPSAARH